MAEPALPSSLQGVRAIIVEDSFAVANGLQFLLESWHCEVTGMAANVRKALELVDRGAFDIAILDIDLGGDTVAPVAERLREQDRLFVFLSGYGDVDMLPRSLHSFVRLEKPVDADLLVKTIWQLLGRPAG
jgi:DNA-binding NtrC family response regulator